MTARCCRCSCPRRRWRPRGGEQRFARRRRDAVDDALGTFVGGWLWRHYGAVPTQVELAVRLRAALGNDGAALGNDGAAIATYFERHLADQPFPWPELAGELGTSTRTLQRRFAALGQAPSAILHG